MAAILDAILNFTFVPNIWNVNPSFFPSLMGHLQGSRVKIRGYIIAHRLPLSSRTSTDAQFIRGLDETQQRMMGYFTTRIFDADSTHHLDLDEFVGDQDSRAENFQQLQQWLHT